MRAGVQLALLLACVQSAPTEVTDAGEEDKDWYDDHIVSVASWAAEACTHILDTRAAALKEDPCASFIGDHGKQFMDARANAIGTATSPAELCAEVAHILSDISDIELEHLQSKKPLKAFCGERFDLHSHDNDGLARLKHFFVLGTRRKEEL